MYMCMHTCTHMCLGHILYTLYMGQRKTVFHNSMNNNIKFMLDLTHISWYYSCSTPGWAWQTAHHNRCL